MKSVAISVRVPHDDAEFISKLSIEGANSPSEKLRAIISDAKLRHQGTQDFSHGLALIEEMLAPLEKQLQLCEHEQDMHSELLSRILNWLPSFVAFLISSSTKLSGNKPTQSMHQIESGAAERIFRLFESLLQLTVTPHSGCYENNNIHQHIAPLLALSDVIRHNHPQLKEKNNE